MAASLPSPQSDVEITAAKPVAPTNPYTTMLPAKTNCRIVYDLGTKAGLPFDRIHTTEKDVVIKQNMSDKRRMASGCTFLPNNDGTGIKPVFFNGMQSLELEECKPTAVRKLAKEMVKDHKRRMQQEGTAADKENSAPSTTLNRNKDPEVGIDFNGVPPTPKTNRRVLYYLAVAAEVTPRRTKKLQDQIRLNQAVGTQDYPTLGLGEEWSKDRLEKIAPGKLPGSMDDCERETVDYVVQRYRNDLPAEKRVEAEDKLEALRRAGPNLQEKDMRTFLDDREQADGPKSKASGKTSKSAAQKKAKPPTPSPTAGDKRRASDISDISAAESSTSSHSSGSTSNSLSLPPPITDCDESREKTNKLRDADVYKAAELETAFDVKPGEYYKFMQAKGPRAGSRNPVYKAAQKFSQEREARGRKTSTASKTASKQAAAAQDLEKIKDIHLDGEDEDAVPIFDSCNEIRRKINAYLKHPYVTQAQFMRDISAQFKTQNVSIHAAPLGYFRRQKGPTAGNSSNTYYGAYVFFEKLRIAEGKGKTKHREEMEEAWSPHGVDREGGNKTFICRAGENVYKDKLGKISIFSRGSGGKDREICFREFAGGS